MAKDFARGERMMRQAIPINVDKQNDTPQQGNSITPSWQNRGYGWKALESDTMPPIPEHFRTGSWMNRFGAGHSPETDQGQTEKSQSEQSLLDKSDSKKQLIAFGEEWSITQDPVTGLFILIFGGIIYAGQKTLEGANNLLQQVMKSTHDHGGGKNDQHGKSEPPPHLVKELETARAKLAELKRNQGSKKEKIKLETKIRRLQAEIDKVMKGEPHNRKAKGSNGQTKR